MIALLILALALAMGAFAVSLTQGAAGRMRIGQACQVAAALYYHVVQAKFRG